MAVDAPTPDLAAYARVALLGDFQRVAQELVRLIGQFVTAQIADVDETRAVRQWAAGERTPRDPAIEERLRLALTIAYMIEPYDDPPVIRSWFTGLNPILNDRQPLAVLRDENLGEFGPKVLGAARNFIGRG